MPKNCQVVLTDRKRPTKPEARERTEGGETILPFQDYEAGRCFHSVVEIRRIDADAARLKLVSVDEDLLALSAGVGAERYLTVANFASGDSSRNVEWDGREISVRSNTIDLMQRASSEE